MSGVVQLSSNVFLLRNEETKRAAYVEVMPGRVDSANAPSSPPSRTPSPDEHIKWGKDDDQPNIMHRLATDNDVKWALMSAKRDFIVGKGLRAGTIAMNGKVEEFTPLSTSHGNFGEIAEHLAVEEEMGYHLDTAMQVSFAGQHFTRITLDKSGRVLPLEVMDCFEMRYRALGEKERRPSAMFNNGNFGTRNLKKQDHLVIPVFDPANPQGFPVAIYHAKHRLPGQPFYAFAPWWGTKSWTEVANLIPHYHISGLTYGYNIKYLIRIPDDYFDKEGLETQEDKDAYRDKVLSQMKESLAGKADRALVTYFKTDYTGGKAFPGVEIIDIKNTMTDDAYVALYNVAKQSQASGHDMQPSLVGIDTGGKMGGSGKEMEVAANYQQKFRTYADRQLLLRPYMIKARINQWDPLIKFQFQDIEVYTPDVTPTGVAVNPNKK